MSSTVVTAAKGSVGGRGTLVSEVLPLKADCREVGLQVAPLDELRDGGLHGLWGSGRPLICAADPLTVTK